MLLLLLIRDALLGCEWQSWESVAVGCSALHRMLYATPSKDQEMLQIRKTLRARKQGEGQSNDILRYDTAISIMNSEPLQSPAWSRHKTDPIESWSWM